MPEEKDNIKELCEHFVKLNLSFIREVMECHFIKFEEAEFTQGKFSKGKATKHYKELR